jgi:hypothetical protein
MKGINMSVAKELFEKTNAIAGKLRSNPRVVISPPPQRKRIETKSSISTRHRYGPEDRPPPLSEILQRDKDRNGEREKKFIAPAKKS